MASTKDNGGREKGRSIGADALWKIYEALPRVSDRVFREAARSVLPFTRMTIPVRIFSESRREASRSLLLAGPLRGSHFLLREFFQEEPECRLDTEVSLWRLRRRLEELGDEVDLSVVRIPDVIAGFLSLPEGLDTPLFVGCSRPPCDPETALPSRNTLRADLKRADERGFEVRWSRDPCDFDRFYHEMHLPFVLSRFGDDATLYGIERLRRAFRFGGLLQLVDAGRAVAGVLVQGEGSVYRVLVFGIREGAEESFRREGGGAALYRACLVRALRKGYRSVDLGLGRSHLRNGILRYKRKWGITIDRRRYPGERVCYYWPRLNAPVASFLERTCPIFEKAGGLSALVVTGEEVANVPGYLRGLRIPGLNEIYCIASGRDRGPGAGENGPGTVYIPWGEVAGKPVEALRRRLRRPDA